MKPLVSILIPAYNAEEWIASSVGSAIAQTWPRKEIIVVNDGSRDRTAEIARRFASKEVAVVSTDNQGLSAAVNHAFRLCQGDYIQELDADDILAPDKIERQISALRDVGSRKILLSSPWAHFCYRTGNARFVRNSLCQDLSPVEWLLRKMGENLFMQNATWLVSRDLAEAAGPWETRLHYDQDGEYFARVLVASEGTLFVPGTGVFYRRSPGNRISNINIGNSDKKKESLLLSVRQHIRLLRSLEDSDRVRNACLKYLQNQLSLLYPERPDLVAELQQLAIQLRVQLQAPHLRWKYAWMIPLFGWKLAKWTEATLPNLKVSCIRSWDKAMFKLQPRRDGFVPLRNNGKEREVAGRNDNSTELVCSSDLRQN